MINKTRLAEKCSTWNITLSPAQLDLLDRYAEILVDYNQKVNLTAITSPEGIEDRHFADSLLFAAQPEVTGKLVDVGTGAGFPGVVAKIFKPDLQLTLMEPTGKRVDFLKYLCGELGLTGVEFAKERAEEAARKIWREQFDVASARAVAALPVLCEYCLPLVRVGGVFIAMKGPDADAELGGSAAALKKLGGAYGDTRAFTLPDGSERRLVVCKKISQTPTAYPRNGEKIAKKLHGSEVIALFGGLGMGKTAFTRGLARALGVDDGVSSPTFALVNEYSGKYNIYHFDMYRVNSWDDLYSTGFFDYIDNGILVIEWSENIEGALPENAIRITIEKGESDDERIFEIEGVEI